MNAWEYGVLLAAEWPALTAEQVEAAARAFLTADEAVAA